jgi:protein-tyrosine phosphatase
MVDLHHHLLFGLDDGATDLPTSVAMARAAAADGITHVVCTPHASSAYAFDPALIQERLTTLRAKLAAENIPLTLGQGCDFHLNYDNIQDALAHPAKYAINGGAYLLVELPDFGLPASLTETFYQFRLAGTTPILTHPERNPALQKDDQRLADWLRDGMLVQVTAGSVVGRMGKTAQKVAWKLLEQRWVHFLATDAHNVTSRPPEMRVAYEAVAARCGSDYAELLCVTNPQAVWESQPLAPQQEPRGLFVDDFDKPSLWKRLLGRA